MDHPLLQHNSGSTPTGLEQLGYTYVHIPHVLNVVLYNLPHSHSYQSDSVLMYLIQLEHPWQGGAMRRRGRSNWWTLKIWPHLQRVWRKQILDLKAGLDFVEAIAQQ